MKKVSKWIVCLASLTAINFSAAPLSAVWNPSVDIAGPPISAECCAGTTGPVLTINASNNGIGVWQGRAAEFPLCSFCDNIYASSYTFGLGWGPPVIISDPSMLPPPDENIRQYINQGDPDIMMNDSGYAVAVWEGTIQVPVSPVQLDDYNVILSATRSSAGIWSPVQTVRILDPIDFYPQNASVAVNESGLAVAMWNEQRGDNQAVFIMASFLPFGGVWTAPVQLDAPGFFGVVNIAGDVELNDNGNAVAVWQIGFDPVTDAIHAATYDPLTGIWTTVSLDSDPGVVSEIKAPEAAIDDNGNAVVVWNRETAVDGFTSEIAAASFTYGSGWGPSVIIYSAVGQNLSGPYVVMDHLGTATAVWGNNSTGEVFSSRLPLGGTWSVPELIGLGTFDPYSVQEAASVDDLGNVIVIIQTENGILQSILRTVLGGWQPPENIFNDSRVVNFPNIGLGSCGFALALWRNEGISRETTFIQGADNFALANFLLAPTNFVGSRCCQKFATQTACVSRFSWDPVDCALFYYIRRNGVLIATIPAGGSTTFDYLECCRGHGTFTLSVVNIYGIESPGVSITLP